MNDPAAPVMDPPPPAQPASADEAVMGPMPIAPPAPGAAARATAAMAGMQAPAPKAAPSQPGSSAAKEPAAVAAKTAPSKQPAGLAEQLIIFTGNLQMRVLQDDFSSTIDQVVDVAAALGGFIVAQNNNSVTVRVPSGSFRDAMRKMGTLGEVTSRQVQAQDVTEEHHDLKVRLKSLRATRKRLEAFLDRAKNIQEVLRVEQELNRLNGEIDKIEGRMRFLAARAAFSTISVALIAKPKKVVVVERDGDDKAPAKTIALPIKWLQSVGLDDLLQLR